MRWVPSRLVPSDGSTALSLAALIFVFVLLGVFALNFLSQRNTNRRLDKTVKIACDFIQADGDTRRRQAKNSLQGQLIADRKLAENSGRLLPLLKKAEETTTGSGRSGLILFDSFIESSHDAAVARVKTTAANVAASQVLAAKADQLVAECSK